MPASLNGILSLARSGLLSQQLALQVTSNNLANATTEGYSRQRAELVPTTPLRMPEGLLGTGVRVADITRARDVILDRQLRRETSLFHGFQSEARALTTVESLFAEPGVGGLTDSLDAFWNAWSDLANDPGSASARTVVLSRGTQLAEQVRRIDASLSSVTSEVTDRLRSSVERVNGILEGIAELNEDIVSARASGRSAPELADRRDLLLDELATFVPVEVAIRDGGAVGVSVNGISVVEGVAHQTLDIASGGGVATLVTSSGLTIGLSSGRIGGALRTVNDDFSGLRAELDAIAQGLVERVNAIHVTGTNPTGTTGVPFFEDFGDPSLVTAGTLEVNAAVVADSALISAGQGGAGGGYASGANDVALDLSNLRDAAGTGVLGPKSVNEALRDLLVDLGLSVRAAEDAAEVHDALRTSALERRESVSGVASDEELVKVVQIQAAYTAASRLVSVVDEMYQALLSI